MKILLQPTSTEQGRAGLLKENVSCFISGKKAKVISATVDSNTDQNLFFYQMKFANILGIHGYKFDSVPFTFYIQDSDGIHRIIATCVNGNTRCTVMYKNDVFVGKPEFSEDGILITVTEQIFSSETYTPISELVFNRLTNF